MTLEIALGLYSYWIVIFLMMTGFYIVIARGNLVKTIIGLNIFQTSVFLLYITMGRVACGTAPIIQGGGGHDDHGHGHEKHSGHGNGHGGEAIQHGGEKSAELIEHGEHGSIIVDHAVGQAGFTEDVVASAGHAVGLAAEQATGNAAYEGVLYSNPLPSVLMLTAIVVGIATTALALALIVRIREEYGTIEEDEILEMDRNS